MVDSFGVHNTHGSGAALLPFHGARLVTGIVNGVPHVAMKPITEHLGLDWTAQLRRIKRHPVLKVSMAIMAIESQRGDREGTALPIAMLHGWLFGVKVSMAKPELRDLLTSYQAECFAVLDAYWRGGVAVNPRIHVVPDDQPWRTGRNGRTPGQRFAEERARWEARAGRSMVGVMGFSKLKLLALEEHEGALSKPGTLKSLMLLGVDIRYIYHGERVLTDAELAVRDAYRLGTDDDRAAIRRHAEAVRIKRAPERPGDFDMLPGTYAGADTVRYERTIHD